MWVWVWQWSSLSLDFNRYGRKRCIIILKMDQAVSRCSDWYHGEASKLSRSERKKRSYVLFVLSAVRVSPSREVLYSSTSFHPSIRSVPGHSTRTTVHFLHLPTHENFIWPLSIVRLRMHLGERPRGHQPKTVLETDRQTIGQIDATRGRYCLCQVCFSSSLLILLKSSSCLGPDLNIIPI